MMMTHKFQMAVLLSHFAGYFDYDITVVKMVFSMNGWLKMPLCHMSNELFAVIFNAVVWSSI